MILKIFIKVGLFFIGILTLNAFGAYLNDKINWDYLTAFFVFVRYLLSAIDFMWDTTTLYQLLYVSIGILGAYYLFKGGVYIIKYFRKY
jgi:hypothetical protein